MSTPLLTTKLYIPPVRPDPSTGLRARLVPRPRLIERLNAGLDHNLTLISAPAGFGKTTLRALYTNFAVRTCSSLIPYERVERTGAICRHAVERPSMPNVQAQ